MTNETSACECCHRTFPSELCAPLTLGSDVHDRMCPVCALHVSNAYLGIERDHFDGDIAESSRLACAKYYQLTNQPPYE